MLSPLRSSRPSVPSNLARSDEMVLTLLLGPRSIQVHHDGFKIGTGRHCDLILADPQLPRLHSQIHVQSGAIWIETATDELHLIVNDRPCRRMALRDGDRMRIGSTEFAIQLAPLSSLTESGDLTSEPIQDDLASLTAEELCDRIVTEQSMLKELSEDEDSGWEALLQAIAAFRKVPSASESEGRSPADDAGVYNVLLDQIQELQATIADRSRELSEKEAEVLASTSMIEETQQRVAKRLDVILDHLNHAEPNELRASA